MRTPGRITHSLYSSAPDMLLDLMAEINQRMAKEKARNGESDAYQFWLKVYNKVKFAWDYFDDLKFIQKRNDHLEMENRHLRQWCGEQMKRLDRYEVIREAKLDGSFNETVAIVDKYLAQHDNPST